MSEAWNLSISPETVCYVIIKAREFDTKDAVTEADPASNASDDRMVSVLEDQPDDPVESELQSLISDLNEDEQIDLVALAWLGRGDGSVDDWESIRADAAAAHDERRRRPTSSARRCLPTTWRKQWRNSASRARSTRSGASNTAA